MDSARQSRHVCQQPSNVGGCRQYTNRGCPFPCIAELCGLHSKFLSMQHMQHAQAKPRCGTSVVDCTFTNLSKSSCHDGNGSLRLSRNPPRSLLIQEPCPAVQRQGANLRNFTSSQTWLACFCQKCCLQEIRGYQRTVLCLHQSASIPND